MTDEQVTILADAFNQSSLSDDLIVAVLSGLIILAATFFISYIISKKQSEEAKEEMINKIKMETMERLVMEKQFYIDKMELEDYQFILSNLVILTTVISKVPSVMIEKGDNKYFLKATFDERRILMNEIGLVYRPIKDRIDLYKLDDLSIVKDLIGQLISNIGKSNDVTNFYGEKINELLENLLSADSKMFTVKSSKMLEMGLHI